MAEKQDLAGGEGHSPSLFTQTTEEAARAAVAAAAAIRPRPSIVISAKYQRDNSFQKWRRQLQKAWKWGLPSGEGRRRAVFNPEVLTNQKRQWIELQLHALGRKERKEPTCIFEHFVVVGLHPATDGEATEAAFAKKKAWEKEREKLTVNEQYRSPPLPTLEPQVLFKFPPGKRLPLKSRDLPAFCFPGGVEARLMERTPSMSDLNEVVYGQDHQKRDDLSFVFVLKVADNVTLYGVCVFVQEIVQKLPGFLASSISTSSPHLLRSRFLATAPRCYCILTKLPFFPLHFEVLNTIIAQERLDRIKQCVSEMSLASEQVPPMVKVGSKSSNGKLTPSTGNDDPDDWMESAIRVENVLGATAAAAGLISESNASLLPHRISTNDAAGIRDRSFEERSPVADDRALAALSLNEQLSEGNRDTEDKENQDDDMPTFHHNGESSDNHLSISGVEAAQSDMSTGHERVNSSDSIYSSIQSVDSEDDGALDIHSSESHENDFGTETVLAWAEDNNNDTLKIICAYQRVPIPTRGSSLVFQPLEHLQPITFSRTGNLPVTWLRERGLDLEACKTSLEYAEAHAAALAEEQAVSLSVWTVATLCRKLSLENVLYMLTGALLEKQLVVICPNLGILSAAVLSLIPMIRPFEWQSLLLPVLPNKMLDFLDAPVPFIVGVQHKNSDVRAKISNLIRINVYKDQVKMSSLPQLPRYKELAMALEPYHSKLAGEKSVAEKHPVHDYTDSQAKAAEGFLAVLRSYLESLCMDVQSHTITNVQSNNNRISLLLKDSFIDSFPSRDRPFIKVFADTQLFSVHTDAVLSSLQSNQHT
ncbi:hypothetical protein O6H91_16G037400 [Diphasiastrum complanatum]|uniref:Uncharacterized protein n=1 Tax=Diphasiastrum complanatum TaxID=34168 RepID=A0ACC2BBI7_DIPCM|nr:hypothetical protein O6H91_16G037400 [Diphasiastrum complanatum]